MYKYQEVKSPGSFFSPCGLVVNKTAILYYQSKTGGTMRATDQLQTGAVRLQPSLPSPLSITTRSMRIPVTSHQRS